MSIFNELDSVVAVRDLNDNVKSGTTGVIHQIYEGSNTTYYLVEFIIDAENSIIEIIDVVEKDLKLEHRW